MKIRFTLLFIFLSVFYLPSTTAYERKPISVDYAMHMAEMHSPSLSVAEFNEIAAIKSIDVARAPYFPLINAETLVSSGFPGSESALGITGLIGSPFRKGAAGGAVAEQIIFDFGRTYFNVEAAKHEAESSHQTTRVTAYQVKQLTLQIYYECTKFRTLRDVWAGLSKKSAVITKEAQHFVNTGQVSIVDRYLSRAETEEALTAKAFFGEQMERATRELAILMGVPSNTFTCPRTPNALTPSLDPNTPMNQSPFLWRAAAEANAAQARVMKEKSGLMPKIVAMSSVGDVEDTHLRKNPHQPYSAGLGIVIPLFDYEVNSKIKRAAALAMAKNQEINAQKLFLEEENAKYDRLIYSSEVRLKHLSIELKIARKAFKVAKDRYFTLEGNLIDLRDAFRNLMRVETDVENTRALVLQAKGSKALLNGSSIIN